MFAKAQTMKTDLDQDPGQVSRMFKSSRSWVITHVINCKLELFQVRALERNLVQENLNTKSISIKVEFSLVGHLK